MKRPWKLAVLLAMAIGVAPCSVAQARQPPKAARILYTRFDALYVTDVSESQGRLLGKGVRAAALSPDGDLVAYADEKAIRVLSLATGQSVTLASWQDGRIEGLAWSPTQTAVAYQLTQADGSKLFLAAYPPRTEPPRNLGPWYETISFSPDGKLLLHPANLAGTTTHGLEVVHVDTGKRDVLFAAPALRAIFEAEYSPEGSRIAFTLSQPPPPAPPEDEPDCSGPELHLWVLTVESKSLVEIDLRRVHKEWRNVKDFAWSPDGKFLAVGIGTVDCDYPGSANGVFITSVDQRVQFKLSHGQQSLGALFAPDGKQVVFTEYADDAYHPQLVIGDLATRKLTPLPTTRSREVPTALDWK
jgi:Tol biopolymer transport system component